MNKSALYIFLLFICLGGLRMVHTYNHHQPIVLEKNGLQMTDLNRQHLVLYPQKNDAFITHDQANNQTAIYRVNVRYSGSSKMDILRTIVPYEKDKENDLFIATVNGQLHFPDTLRMDSDDRMKLIADLHNFSGRRLIQVENEPLWLKLLDSSSFMIPFMILFSMAIFWLVDRIIRFANRTTGRDCDHIIKHIFIALFIICFYIMTNDDHYSASWISAMIRVILIVVPVYLLLQYVIKKYLPNKDFPDQEFIKFSILFLGSCTTLILSTIIARWVDNTIFGASPYTTLNVINPIQLMIFFAFNIAGGNLLNNVLKYYLSHRNTREELKQTKKEVLASQAALQALQASVNPHFLYNSLNSIASLAQTDPVKTEDMTLALSNFYKYTVNRKNEHLTTLSEEIEMIKSYLKIEKIRFGARLHYEINCSENTFSKKLPHFLLQPIVENAIKYGYNKDKHKIEIKISCTIEHGHLNIQIFDNGTPFKNDMQSGYGLRSVTKKLKLLFPDQHAIEFINEPEKHVSIII